MPVWELEMTHDQRNAAIKQMLENHAKTVSVSKEAARKFLINGGFYTADGHLAPKYSGDEQEENRQSA